MALTTPIGMFAVRADRLVFFRSPNEAVSFHVLKVCVLRRNASYGAFIHYHKTRERDEIGQHNAKRGNIDCPFATRPSQRFSELEPRRSLGAISRACGIYPGAPLISNQGMHRSNACSA
jgi:hypothetical protein